MAVLRTPEFNDGVVQIRVMEGDWTEKKRPGDAGKRKRYEEDKKIDRLREGEEIICLSWFKKEKLPSRG